MLGSISKAAKQATGSVTSGLRMVQDFNPSAIPFTFPPQVQLGITAAQQVSDRLGLGLKVPSTKDIEAYARGEVDLILKGVKRDVVSKLESLNSKVSAGLDTAEKVLDSIDWLL